MVSKATGALRRLHRERPHMTRLLRRIWHDDDGAVVSVELVLIISILVFGLIPGLVALRNSGISLMATLGNMANALIPSFTFSGFAITAGSGMSMYTVVQVNGVQFNPTPQYLSGLQVAPQPVNGVVVPPSP
jgi:Flp pilus assembly pilin Flp